MTGADRIAVRTSEPLTFEALTELDNQRELAETVTPWLHEAANPYFDFMFGGDGPARKVLSNWIGRESSEYSLQRLIVMFDHDTPVGAFIALSGAELSRCRKADTVALAREVRRTGGDDVLTRFRLVRGVGGVVRNDEFYLSKVMVAPLHRGRGLGRALVREFVARGLASGFHRFRLEVAPDNTAAVALYQSEGFVVTEEVESSQAGMSLLSMAMERGI